MPFRRFLSYASLALVVTACAHQPAPAEPNRAPSAPSSPPAAAPPSSPANPPPRGAIGAMCGGIAGFRCNDGLYCDFPGSSQCGASDQSGTCQPKPEMCTKIYKPVCGCDAKTYGNGCEARSAGVSIASDGACRAQ